MVQRLKKSYDNTFKHLLETRSLSFFFLNIQKLGGRKSVNRSLPKLDI